MRTIYKYPLVVAGAQRVTMPSGAQLLHVEGEPCSEWSAVTLWALVDTDQPPVERVIVIAGTGHPAPEAPYVGTALSDPFVWHVFDGGE